MRKILVINDIRFARHTEVFDGERDEFPFSDLAVARAARENGHAEVAFHKILDRGYVVYFQNNIEVGNVFAERFERGIELSAGRA